jgi:hypothetical protein
MSPNDPKRTYGTFHVAAVSSDTACRNLSALDGNSQSNALMVM